LIVLNEILRCSNANWEKKYENLKRLKAGKFIIYFFFCCCC
jgi:hypothetical protein